MKVGFIGLGRMGQAMARRLLDAKHDVGVYNRTPQPSEHVVINERVAPASDHRATR